MRTLLMAFSLLAATPEVVRADPPKQTAASSIANIEIEGLDCAACTVAIRIALKKVSGVRDAKVIYEEKRATVEYDPAKVTPRDLVDAVAKLGYKASLSPQKS